MINQQVSTRIRVGHLSFAPAGFTAVSMCMFIFALSAGSLLPRAERGGSWSEVMLSGQTLSLTLLMGFCCFVYMGVISRWPERASIVRVALLGATCGHAWSTFVPLL
ncbi:hypothetical protein D3C78_1402090 [compost metagenome]